MASTIWNHEGISVTFRTTLPLPPENLKVLRITATIDFRMMADYIFDTNPSKKKRRKTLHNEIRSYLVLKIATFSAAFAPPTKNLQNKVGVSRDPLPSRSE